MPLIPYILLFIHIFFAIIFIGGSFFIWIVVWPASFQISQDEKQRTLMVGKIAKRFAYFTHISLAILVATGLYLGYWYIGGNPANLLHTVGGMLLLSKAILVAVMIITIYGNNIYHGRKITRLAREGKLDQVKRIRRVTHLISFASLGMLIAIVGLAASLQFF
ncbi:MAG TPA: CopD family protein [Thermoplasmataceae archaeon]|nr:CopD family protein [Thermoplasmataceae archaeon]